LLETEVRCAADPTFERRLEDSILEMEHVARRLQPLAYQLQAVMPQESSGPARPSDGPPPVVYISEDERWRQVGAVLLFAILLGIGLTHVYSK
jgi:hypothetical protein